MKTKKPVLMSADNPKGWKLEDLANQLIQEITAKSAQLEEDERQPARVVLGNNAEIVRHLSTIVVIQRHSLRVLDSVGPDQGPTGTPRVGKGSRA